MFECQCLHRIGLNHRDSNLQGQQLGILCSLTLNTTYTSVRSLILPIIAPLSSG